MATNQEKFDNIHHETTQGRSPSRSFMATDGNDIDSPLGIAWNTDGNAWTTVVTNAYLFDVEWAKEVVETIANNGVFSDTYARSNPWLSKLGREYCQGLIKHRERMRKLDAMLDAFNAKDDA